MSVWIDRSLLAALLVVVAGLAVTASGTLVGEPLGGETLLAHMMFSGVLVVGLPVFAVVFLRHLTKTTGSSSLQACGYLATVAAGMATIATVFCCMLPIPSTDQMHALMAFHGWFGFAMIPAVGVLLIGTRLTRSTSRHRS